MSRAEIWIDDETLGAAMRVGRLTKAPSKTGDTIHFEYTPEWLDDTGPARSFALDPQLHLTSGPHYARSGASSLTGALLDVSPERWGKRLMDRREAIEAREQGRKPRTLRAWDYLAGVNDGARMGALRLKDQDSGRYIDDGPLSAPPMTELRELEAIAAHVEAGTADESREQVRWLRQLLAPGASLGGARPKASFRDPEGQLWLAKFPSNEDRIDVGLWEFVTHQLSVAAGIVVPDAKLLRLSNRGHTYATKRFDRTPSSRRAYSSAMTRLDATESEGSSYLDIVQVIESSGTSKQIGANLEQLFRRALFNILVGNRDDHLRNHGFLRVGDGWELAPAFDVNPNPHKDHHVLAINEADPSPHSGLLLAMTDYYRLDKQRSKAVVDQVRAAVCRWEGVAMSHGASGSEAALMRAIIDAER